MKANQQISKSANQQISKSAHQHISTSFNRHFPFPPDALYIYSSFSGDQH
jgi:hypothetical protein